MRVTLTKKNKPPKKVPEKSANEKINHYKGETRTLKKRLDNLEKRVKRLEDRQEKKKNKPDVKKTAKEEFKERYYPKKKESK